jgi:hypothetical protein
MLNTRVFAQHTYGLGLDSQPNNEVTKFSMNANTMCQRALSLSQKCSIIIMYLLLCSEPQGLNSVEDPCQSTPVKKRFLKKKKNCSLPFISS